MASQKYEQLTIEQFGTELLQSQDLDPIYSALVRLRRDKNLSHKALKRWLLAYWCLYHAGAACYLAGKESGEFWDALAAAAANNHPSPTGGRWPRGKERRYFRGQAAIKAVQLYRQQYESPEQMVDHMAGNLEASEPYGEVAKRVQEHHLFGPWISFKVGDMLERVLGMPVDFTSAEVFMFKDPREAAVMLWRERCGMSKNARPKDEGKVISEVVKHLRAVFVNFFAPPSHDRPVGLQEIETILCKWKSHRNGHYPVNNDIIEINHGLEEWRSFNTLADAFAFAMPKVSS